jgi:hypothetical protein
MARKLKTKLHFNRVNMVRGKSEVCTAYNSHGCFQGEKLVIRHNGVVVAETIYNPEANQPRAYFVAHGNVSYEGKTAVVDV